MSPGIQGIRLGKTNCFWIPKVKTLRKGPSDKDPATFLN